MFEKLVFTTRQGEDNAVIRCFFNKFSIIISGFFYTVTPPNQEEMTDGTVFYTGNDLVGHAKNGFVSKTHQNFHILFVFCIPRQFKSPVNQRSKIVFVQMRQARHSKRTRGEDVFLILLFWFLNTIGSHEDGARKIGKFFFLVLPGGAVMAVKMGET